jgi:hypothetical protein
MRLGGRSYRRYGLNDVQATWECFAKLKAKFEDYGRKRSSFALA